MANTCAAMGAMSKLIVEGGSAPRTFDSNSERYPILAEKIIASRPYQGKRRITGDRALYSDSVREHSRLIRGAFVIHASPYDMTQWLPRVLWGSGYSLGDTAPEFDILIDRENGIFRYTDCICDRITLRSATESGGEPQNEELLEAIIYLFAKDEQINTTAWPSPEPALDLSGNKVPYNHAEGALTINGNNTNFKDFSLTIDNRVVPLFYNSLTASCFRSYGREITLQATVPFTATTIDDAVAALTTGVAGSLAFTNGLMSTSFTFPHLRNKYETPSVSGKGEIPLNLTLEAFRTAASAEVTVANDDNPTV